MPELPDVEEFRQYFQATSLHQRVAEVDVRSQQLLESIQPAALRDALQGRSFEEADRHGKYLLAHMDGGRWLELHFGMSGYLTYFKNAADDPEYDRMLITFENGYHLAYVSQRKLGEIDIIDEIGDLIEEKDLGPDVMSESFDLDAFKACLADRRGMIKSALMDQSLMAGIGNVYSDEILFQAQIHPRTQVQALDMSTVEGLYETMREVLRVATDALVGEDGFPDSYLTPHHAQDGECPLCGELLQRVKVSGRSAYFCPNRQGKPQGGN